MRTNKTKAKIAANQSVVGAGIAFPSPDLVELCAVVGFDFISSSTWVLRGNMFARFGSTMPVGHC